MAALTGRQWLLAGAVMLGATVALLLVPIRDYIFYVEAARLWRSGAAQLYTAPVRQFFYAPWSLLIIVPLSYLPDPLGRALLTLASFGGICWGVVALSEPRAIRSIMLACASIPAMMIIWLAQWDGIVLGSVGLCWLGYARHRPWLLGLGLALVSTKPNNVILLGLVLLSGVWRWPPRDLARAAVGPLLALLLSLLFGGLDWPLRYLGYISAQPPAGFNISLWQAPGAPALPALVGALALAGLIWVRLRRPLDEPLIGLTLAVSLLISPFVVPYHLVFTLPALAQLHARRPRLGLGLWLLVLVGSLVALLRISDLPIHLYLLALPLILGVELLRSDRS
jgi:hypothetical protein